MGRKQVKLKKILQYEIFLLPAFATFTLFTIIPLVKTIAYSVTDFNGVNKDYQFVGLRNYISVFQDEMMRHALFNTLFYTLCTMLLINLIAIPLAVLLDKNTRIKAVERAVFFFPSVVSALLLGYIWGYILSPMQSGALNAILGNFGVKPIGWTATEWGAKIAIILVAVWTSTGWHATVYLAYLQSIPGEYYEAAAIDGASRWQQFKKITFPLLAPGMTVNTLLLLINGLKVYDLPYALSNKGGPGYSNYTITQMIIQRGLSEKQYGTSTALATVFIILVTIIAGIQFMTMRKREAEMS